MFPSRKCRLPGWLADQLPARDGATLRPPIIKVTQQGPIILWVLGEDLPSAQWASALGASDFVDASRTRLLAGAIFVGAGSVSRTQEPKKKACMESV